MKAKRKRLNRKAKGRQVHWGTRDPMGGIVTVCGKRGGGQSYVSEYSALASTREAVTCPRCQAAFVAAQPAQGGGAE